jgi:hypothetical protein
LVPGGGHIRLRERGRGSPNSDEGRDIVVLYNIYVLCANIKEVLAGSNPGSAQEVVPIITLTILAVMFYGSMYSGTAQYSTVQYSTVQYSTVQYSTVQYSTVLYSTVQYSTVQYSTVHVQANIKQK